MLVKSGGGPIAVGILIAIMLGASRVFQLLFAGLLESFAYKKKISGGGNSSSNTLFILHGYSSF
jgi:hypothetical protein